MNIAELGIKVESAGAEQAGDALDALVQSGARAEQAAGKVGAAWDAAGKKVSKSADGATASIEEQREELSKLIGQIDPTVAALDRLDAQQKKLQGFKSAGLIDAETFERFNSRLEQTRTGLSTFDDNLNRTGNTAKQTAAALRGVPAQFTDIVVSLQAGQAPLTVLLQQGGQLKDMFGGIGPAARALGGYVAGLVNPFTAAAAAVGVLGLAYYQGSEESERYAKALILTGNAAGTSANQLAGIAEKISAVSGTTGQAAEALTLLASTGKVSADNLEAIGSAAVSFSSATGTAISDVVQQYAELGKAPVEASRKLNEQYGYLTTAVYQQITALEEQGKTQEAATLAQQTFAAAQQQMAIRVKANLGTLETAWSSLASGAKKAWDAMLGLGRESTLEKRISDLKSFIADRERLGGYDNTDFNRQLAALQQQLKITQDQSKAEEDQRRGRVAGSAAIDLLSSKAEAGLDKQAKKTKELADLEKARAAALSQSGVDSVKIQKDYELAVRGVEERYKEVEKKQRKVAAPALDTTSVNQLQNDLKLVVGEYDAAEKKIEALSRAGLISQADAYQQRVTLLDQEKAKVQEAYGAQIAAIEQLQGRSNLSAQQRISLENQVTDARAAQTKALTDLDAKREQLSINEQGRQAKLQQATDSYNRSLDAQVDLLRLQGERAAAAVGMGREQAALYNELNKANDEYVKGLRDLDKLLAEGSISQDQYNQRLSALQRQQTQLQEQVIDNFRLMQVAQSDWSNGANAAWQDYLSNARDVAGQTRDAFTDALRGMEDYLLSFITGTKTSFKDLVKSIIADFARIQLKQIISGIGGSSGSSGFLGSVGQAFGFGGGTTGGGSGSGFNNALSLADTGLKAYNFLSGTGSSIYSAYQSGGLQGVYDYGASAIGSYFGSSAASTAAASLTSTGANAAIGAGADATAAGLGYLGSSASSGVSYAAANTAANTAASTGLSTLGAAGYGIGGAIAGYQAAGVKGAATGAAGAIGGAYLGTMILPGIGTIIGAALGSLLGSSVWGGDWQTKDSGLALGVTGGDFDGMSFEYQKKKGGLFGKNKKRTRFSALDEATEAALQETYDTTEESVETLYKRLGVQLNDGVLDGLTIGRTQISTKDKTQEEIQKEITAWFSTVADSMTSAINDATGSGLDGYNFEALTKFVNNLYSVNDAIRYLNVGLYDTSVAGGKLAEALAMTAGGLDALQKNTATYFDQFFTDAEKANATLDSVTRAFKDVDVALPGTREGFRKAVEALDLTTDAGQEMFATLTSMAGQADAYYDVLEARSQAALEHAQAVAQALADAQASMLSSALGTLQRAVQKQQNAIQEAYNARTEALNASLSSSQSAVSSLTSMTNSLSSALKTMLGQSDQATRVLYGQATATLETAAAIARAGGSLANFQGLDDALSTVTGNNSSGYGDWLSFARDQGRSASLIGELSATAGDQLTSAEKTVKGIQDQLDLSKKQFDLESKMLQGQLDLAQAQIDAINGVDNTLLSMVDALNQFAAAVLTASPNGTGGKNADTLIEAAYQSVLGRSADKAGAAYWKDKLVSGQLSSNDLRGAIGQAGAANGESINTAYQNILGRAPDAAGLAYWQQQVAAGNISDINAAIRAAAMANGQIPAFAAGGLYGGGLALVGEKGPELINFNKPGYVHTAADTASMMGGGSNAALLAEVKALRAEIAQVGLNTAATAKHASKTSENTSQLKDVGVRVLETA